MVITNCYECGKVLSNDLRELEGIPQNKIFCKKCRAKHKRKIGDECLNVNKNRI